ncbi:MAG TPA: succinylglutamate desuccinylase/aspartoacylase family protein, partial [Vicinamibacterales bacterium]|nr:succinylglutamate desuccinylase/aspartoacylase family protein [Vicinamibacterales bacterium]
MIDTRPALGELMAAFDALAGGGWQVRTIASQVAPDGGLLPIRAYFNADEVNLVLVAGIHGREPAGPVALARLVPSLIANGLNRRLLVMPLLNPWGYVQCERYGPSGKSVSDSDHLLGRAAAPAC